VKCIAYAIASCKDWSEAVEEHNNEAIDAINEAFSEKISNALAIAMVTRDGEVLFHYAAKGRVNKDPGDAAQIIKMIKELSEKESFP
jgi:hypothetical protein|tara:strand:- start:177 stop:437 length:261 start_codon:yes stop_codon:yes gene_type:complete